MDSRISWDWSNAHSPDFVVELTDACDLPFLLRAIATNFLHRKAGRSARAWGDQDAVRKVRCPIIWYSMRTIQEIDQLRAVSGRQKISGKEHCSLDLPGKAMGEVLGANRSVVVIDHALDLTSLYHGIQSGQCVGYLDNFRFDGLSRCWCRRRND